MYLLTISQDSLPAWRSPSSPVGFSPRVVHRNFGLLHAFLSGQACPGAPATYDFVPGTTHYTVNSHDPKYRTQRPEGGIQILLQPDQPNLSPGVYWLQTPAPKPGSAENTFYLVLRVYAPAPQVSTTQTWSPPAIERVG